MMINTDELKEAVNTFYGFTKAHLGGAIDDTYSNERDILRDGIAKLEKLDLENTILKNRSADLEEKLDNCKTELCTMCGRKKRFEQGWCKECIWNGM